MNTQSILNTLRATRSKLMRLNPLGTLDILSMSRHLARFEAGYLRDTANIWNHLEGKGLNSQHPALNSFRAYAH